MGDRCFLDLEQTQFHALLRRHVRIPVALHQETVLTQLLEQPVLAGLHAVLFEDLRQFADQNAPLARGHRVREQHLRLLLVQLLPLFFDGLLRDEHRASHRFLRGFALWNVTAGTTDLGHYLVEQPMLELDRAGELAAGDEAVHVAFGDEYHLLDSTGRLKGSANHRPLAMLLNGIGRALVSECGGDVLRAEQHRPVPGGHRGDRVAPETRRAVHWIQSFWTFFQSDIRRRSNRRHFLWLESEPCGNGWRTTGWD